MQHNLTGQDEGLESATGTRKAFRLELTQCLSEGAKSHELLAFPRPPEKPKEPEPVEPVEPVEPEPKPEEEKRIGWLPDRHPDVQLANQLFHQLSGSFISDFLPNPVLIRSWRPRTVRHAPCAQSRHPNGWGLLGLDSGCSLHQGLL